MTSIFPEGRTALYRFYDAADALLYVGVTYSPQARFSNHRTQKPWWVEVHRVDVTWHDSREEAEAAELQAILTESPVWNVRDSPSRVVVGSNRVTFRVGDGLWEEFGAAAERAGTGRSTLVRDFIRWANGDPNAKPPARPEVAK